MSDRRFDRGHALDEDGNIELREYSQYQAELEPLLAEFERLKAERINKYNRKLDWSDEEELDTYYKITIAFLAIKTKLSSSKLSVAERADLKSEERKLEGLLFKAAKTIDIEEDLRIKEALNSRIIKLRVLDAVLQEAAIAHSAKGDGDVGNIKSEVLDYMDLFGRHRDDN